MMDIKGKEITLPKDIEEILDEVKTFSKTEFSKDETVEIIMEEGKMVIKARGAVGWATHSKRVKYKG